MAPDDTSRVVTEFQRRVYAALSRVPCGRVTTYGRLAAVVGCRSSQAVGQALRRNPFAPRVPCHRVIAADGTLGGFNGCRTGAELARKRRLLAAEGVVFDARGHLEQPARLWPVSRAAGHARAHMRQPAVSRRRE